MTLSFHGSKSRENKSLGLRLHLNQGIKNQLGLEAKNKKVVHAQKSCQRKQVKQ